ncbi:YeeE/YedE family protein [Rubricoccus marinus]|uniref:YeeE/YedE family protein n=1 Tax=Rubricoccus marinus TaxID=716817 RepID=A0A259TVS3_9BACT|nr:YeeE/YedE thiosulfate transporter family protein [Rubricoccus marinus]OZC01648.1 YeeE/YedE family protein [Rubricoccus marinus]
MLAAVSPLPWYVAGPLIGLLVPILLLVGGRTFGVSANLRHACAAIPLPQGAKPSFLRYDWRTTGAWNLIFALGIGVGGFVGLRLLSDPSAPLALAPETAAALAGMGITDLTGFVPSQLISWSALATPAGALLVIGGGFLVGFGARWAGGCTSGHAITGLATLQVPSLVAVGGFFAGGLLVVHVLLPFLLAP